MNAHPGPMVSGSHFLPAAPLLCTKLIPACLVMSRKRTCPRAVQTKADESSNKERKTRPVAVMKLFIGPGSPGFRSAGQPRPAWLDRWAPKGVRGWIGVRCYLQDAYGDRGR